MAKLFKVVDPSEPGTSGTQCLITDWNKCVLCQEDTDEMLKCPSNSACGTDGRIQEQGIRQEQLPAKNKRKMLQEGVSETHMFTRQSSEQEHHSTEIMLMWQICSRRCFA